LDPEVVAVGRPEADGGLGMVKCRKRRFAFERDNTVHEIPGENTFHYSWQGQVRIILFNSWLSLLLFFIPAGFAVNYTHVNPIAVFVINFIAIIPSAIVLDLAVDEISLRVGEVLQGILSMTFRYAEW